MHRSFWHINVWDLFDWHRMFRQKWHGKWKLCCRIWSVLHFYVSSLYSKSLTYWQSTGYFIVMCPSRAGLSHSSSWRIFSSAWLVTFSFQLRNFPTKARKLSLFCQLAPWDLVLRAYFFQNLVFNFHSVLGLLGYFRLEGKTEFNFWCSCLLT